MMVQVTKTPTILCLMIFHSAKSKNDLIFVFNTSKQLKTLSFSNLYVLTYQKLISSLLYSSDKMIVQVTKTPTILCLMIFHSTKSKNDLIFGLSPSKRLKNTLFQSFICSHRLETNFQPTITAVVHITKTPTILCYIIFHSTKSKNNLIYGFSTSKQLENTLFRSFICSHILETNFQPTITAVTK